MSEDQLADLVAAMDPALVVVTACGASGEVDGCLVGFHSQCSIAPPVYAVWLSVANRTRDLATESSHLGVHLLADTDHRLARHFGGLTGDTADKLATVAWTAGPGGVPLLEELPNRFVGRVESHRAGPGDHDLFVLAVALSGTSAVDPLRLSDATDITPGHDATERR